MSPSTDAPDPFAAEVLDRLVHRLTEPGEDRADPGRYTYRISHAWTRGPRLHLVYRAEPLDITWGLVRDTRESLIDSGPWNTAAEAALYYQLLDFDEGWSGPLSPEPGRDPEFIRWRGDVLDPLPQQLSALTDTHRDTPHATPESATEHRRTAPEAAGDESAARHDRIREHDGLTDADPMLGQLLDLDDRTGTVTRGLDHDGEGGRPGPDTGYGVER